MFCTKKLFWCFFSHKGNQCSVVRRHICSQLEWKRGIQPLRRSKRFPMPMLPPQKKPKSSPLWFVFSKSNIRFFTVSGKICVVSDLNHHEAGEVPHEALARDCHHRDEEWNSGKISLLWKWLCKLQIWYKLSLCWRCVFCVCWSRNAQRQYKYIT